MRRPLFLILSGDGINCENETKLAIEKGQGEANIVHINELLKYPKKLNHYNALIIPGGFSFGDELGSGQVLSLKMKYVLQEELTTFYALKKPILGICNGFQVLTKLGLLPHPLFKKQISLASNEGQQFIDKWVTLELNQHSPCIWTRLIKDAEIELPIRHGEGRIVFNKEKNEECYRELLKNQQIVLTYKQNVNGSQGNIAGICDPQGLIFGLMPHPEAYLSNLTHPSKSHREGRFDDGVGLHFFQSAVYYLTQS